MCDGADPAVISLLGCDVDMSTIINTYGYLRSELILCRVRALNLVGWSTHSSQNSAGVLTQTTPTFMNAPEIDYDSLTDTSIPVSWAPIISDLHTGALTILSYSLEWD